MTKRKHKVPRVDPADFGFELPYMHANTQHDEFLLLLGLDQLAIALYFMCLLPFVDGIANDVRNASYYRFVKMLTPTPTRAGRRFQTPTKQQLRDALKRLRDRGLVRLYSTASMREGHLKIRVVRWFGGSSSQRIGPGVGPGSKNGASRVNAHSAPHLST